MIELLTWSILSILDDERSGPAPSRPCGSIRTMALCFNHFAENEMHEKKVGLTKRVSYFPPTI